MLPSSISVRYSSCSATWLSPWLKRKDEVGAIHAEEAASMLRHGPVNGAGSRVMPRPSGIFLPRQ